MKKTTLFFSTLFLLILIHSCSKDTDTNQQSQKFEGKIYVSIADNIVNGEWDDWEYRVLFEDEETRTLYNVKYSEDELQDYIEKSGSPVRLAATFSDDLLKPVSIDYLDRSQISTRAPGTGDERGKGKGGGATGSASILVVMVSDSTTTPNCTAAEMEYQLIGADNPQSTANLYTLSSKGKFTVGSVTTTEVTIPRIACSLYSLNNSVNPVLVSQGINISSYDYVMYVTAPICSYGGVATLNGTTFHNAYCTWAVVSPHELGHCLGMHHSSAYRSDGSVSAYGDPSCVMATSFREINAPHRIEMGWMKGKNTKGVTSTGTFNMSPLEAQNPRDKQVLIVDAGLINYNTPENYYLSYRAPIGPFDSGMSQSVVNQLSIHTWAGEKNRITRFVGAIAAGETYIDSENGVQFTNMGIVNEVMTVMVEFTNN